MWVTIVKAIHGEKRERESRFGGLSAWVNLNRQIDAIKVKGDDLNGMRALKVGDGTKTKFWLDSWLENRPLKEVYPRIFSLDINPEALVAERRSVDQIWRAFRMEPRSGVPSKQWDILRQKVDVFTFHDIADRYVWDLEVSGDFSVASVRKFLDDSSLGTSGRETRWCRLVPIKLNVMMWRIARDRLPTRLKLRDRGLEVDSLLCPTCNTHGESVMHLFASCTELSQIWSMVAMWWGVDTPQVLNVESLIVWADNVHLNAESRRSFEAVVIVMFWMLWRYRNEVIFGKIKPKKDEIFDDIRSMSYFWINNRRTKSKMTWNRWLNFPNIACIIM